MTYTMKDGTVEVRDTKRTQEQFEACHKSEIKSKNDTVLIWAKG